MLVAYPELTAADFARAVLIAERMDPDYDTKFLRDLGRAFANRYGQTITAERYVAEFGPFV